jgi:hypothetical protein
MNWFHSSGLNREALKLELALKNICAGEQSDWPAEIIF